MRARVFSSSTRLPSAIRGCGSTEIAVTARGPSRWPPPAQRRGHDGRRRSCPPRPPEGALDLDRRVRDLDASLASAASGERTRSGSASSTQFGPISGSAGASGSRCRAPRRARGRRPRGDEQVESADADLLLLLRARARASPSPACRRRRRAGAGDTRARPRSSPRSPRARAARRRPPARRAVRKARTADGARRIHRALLVSPVDVRVEPLSRSCSACRGPRNLEVRGGAGEKQQEARRERVERARAPGARARAPPHRGHHARTTSAPQACPRG